MKDGMTYHGSPSIDPRRLNESQRLNFEDYEKRRKDTLSLGTPPPSYEAASGSRQTKAKSAAQGVPAISPSKKIQFILDEAENDDDGIESCPIFSEMETLYQLPNGDFEWRETARWVKFEELVEKGGKRWSKPHVSTLSLHSVFELRSCLLKGTVLLDMDAFNLIQIAYILSDVMASQGFLPQDAKEQFVETLLKKHKHLYEKKKSGKGPKGSSKVQGIKSMSDMGRAEAIHISNDELKETKTYTALDKINTSNTLTDLQAKGSQIHASPSGIELAYATHPEPSKGNKQFMKKIPSGAEASNILVGEVPYLDQPITAFIRLANSVNLGNITEVPIPTRFIFIVLGPPGGLARYHELGRSIATLLGDEVFHDIAYIAKNREHLLAGVDEFLDSVTVLPPGEWDPAIRIEPPTGIPSQEGRKKSIFEDEIDEIEEERRMREASGLTRSGRLFGGLINDLKRKIPWYWSDFKDGIAVQSVASFFFLYFACLTPIITFGGLLGEATDNNIAAMESLVSGLICGVLYGFFSGQPLTILGSTGPVLVFETIIYDFCSRNLWNYLSFRMWIGLWAAAILMFLVAIDASALVCYITRFTEENFATLIAFIFIYNAIVKLAKIGYTYPLETDVDGNKTCDCFPSLESGTSPFDLSNLTETLSNESFENKTSTVELSNLMDSTQNGGFNSSNFTETFATNWINYTFDDCQEMNGTLIGDGCQEYYPDVFLLSILLFCGTYFITVMLKDFKTSRFFPTWVRQLIADFAVVIAIVGMSLLDMALGIHTPKLIVPSEFKPTRSDRGWLVEPFAQNPWWSCLVAVIPALLACILFFMDQQITAVIVNRKEHKLKKGCGYHLDLFVLSILIAVNSVMGLPWFVAATVLAINHVNSLKLETECAAPGEKPQFLGIRENRLTHILIFLFIGLSVLLTPILKNIPMPVLFGVFLYMGVSPLDGIQFFHRILIIFMPVKYQPDFAFLLKVPLRKVHLFTLIQLFCLVALWLIKSFPQTSILFPLMLVVMVGIRKLLDFCFTQRELKILDDALPEFKRKEKQKEVAEREKEKEASKSSESVAIPLANGNIMRVPMNQINISEEVQRSGVWKDINNDYGLISMESTNQENCRKCRRRRKSRKSRKLGSNFIDFDKSKSSQEKENITDKRWVTLDVSDEEEIRRLSTMHEEDETQH